MSQACPNCGLPLTIDDISFCTQCGRRLPAGVRFCTGCGASVPQPAPAQRASSGHADAHVAPGPRLAGLRATVALVSAAALIAGGIIAGFQFGRNHGQAPAAGRAVASRQHRSPSPAQTAALAPVENSSASSMPPPSGLATPAPPSPTPSASSTDANAVAVGPLAADQPDAAKVAAFLSRYFAAIKSRNYAAYAALFAANALPNTTARQFRKGDRSSRDSNAELVNLAASPPGLAASVTFRSHQSAAASARHTSCTLWGVTFYLQPDASSYLIDVPPTGYRASHRPCP